MAKVTDIVGLYLHPPDNAVVLCVDEKSRIQALERTQPILPLKEGQAAKQSHDYRRHGTTTLFAALKVATGKVTDACYPRHRGVEFLRSTRARVGYFLWASRCDQHIRGPPNSP